MATINFSPIGLYEGLNATKKYYGKVSSSDNVIFEIYKWYVDGKYAQTIISPTYDLKKFDAFTIHIGNEKDIKAVVEIIESMEFK